METDRKQDTADFVRKVLIVIALAALAAAAWNLSSLLIVIFGGILLAVVLRRLAALLAGISRLPERWALRVVFVLFGGVVIGSLWFFTVQMADQVQQLRQRIMDALETVQTFLSERGLGNIASDMQGSDGAVPLVERLMSGVTGAASTVMTSLALMLIVVFVAIYTAVNPELYRSGVLLLVPKGRQDQMRRALDEAGKSLWLWVMGQFMSMIFVGVASTVALLLLDVPMAFALGLIAGLLEFIPILGPWLAAVPAVLVGLTEDVTTALWVAVAYFVIQQIESYVVLPLAERWSVALPPALTVVSTMAFTLMFGFIGLIFATPITVVVMVLVRQLYVRGALGKEPSPGSKMPG